MARISIREYEHLALVPGGVVPVGLELAVAFSGALTPTGTNATYALQGGDRTHFVRIATDAAISISFGDNTTEAVAGTCDMAAGQTEYFGIGPGVTHIGYITTG